jgi:uncharacterized protein (TIGR02118 family)
VRKIVALLPSAPADFSGLERSLEDDRAVLFGWLDDGDAVPDLPEGAQAWEVDERVQWDADDVEPGVKRVSFIRRLPSLDRDAFATYWSERHAPLARRHHPGIRRYVQNVVIAPLTDGTPDIDGIAELSFASIDDMRARLYDSEEGKAAIAADIGRFIDLPAGSRVLVAERAT